MALIDPPTTHPRSLSYQPALDGLRGLAVLAVVAYHLGVPWAPRGGAVGVTLFFSLSGYLITSLLLTEIDRSDRVLLGRFYARRALRLFPALLLVVAAVAGYALTAAPAGTAEQNLGALPWVLLYLGNWYRAFEGFGSLGFLDHTWTLSVEEQFYLLWPPVVLALLLTARGARRWRRRLLAAALVGSVAPLVVRLLVWDGVDASAARVLNGTDTAADPLMMGCALAIAISLRGGLQAAGAARLRRGLVWGFWPAAALLVADATLRLDLQRPELVAVSLLWGPTLLGLASTAVVGWTVLRSPVVLGWRPLRAVGLVSYGVYLWHYPVIRLLEVEGGGPLSGPEQVLATALSLALAALSYVVVERPLLRLKRRFPPGERRPEPPAEDRDAAPLSRAS
jgi:peptidoglycan/LPS O-acetylase OafA/YrhL